MPPGTISINLVKRRVPSFDYLYGLIAVVMLEVGRINTLTILRDTSVGLFLGSGEEEVLLPRKYLTPSMKPGETLDVFVYLDHEERPVATTLEPYIQLDDFAYLRVNHINRFGAFMDWGLEKDLFVPFREQARPMEEGKRYLVYLYLDEKTNRLVGTSKTNGRLSNDELTVEKGDEVELVISHITEAGINVIVNGKHKGLVYKNEVFDERVRTGDRRKGYIKAIRPDNKLDVALQPQGYAAIEPNAQKILDRLRNGRGVLKLTDNSDPDDIRSVLQMSKKTFKKAVGALYRDKLVTLRDDGIYLV